MKVYLAGPLSKGDNPYDWHEMIESLDGATEWVNPFMLNDYTPEEAQSREAEIAEQDFEAVRESDAVLVRRISEYNLSGASMEAREANAHGVPVVVWNDGDGDVPLMLRSQADSIHDSPESAVREVVKRAE